MNNSEKTMDKIVALCKNRGFVFPGSEIYGGLSNSWDYGPLGVEFKNNVKRAWWKKFVQENPYNVGLDSAIIMNPRTWVASGHLGGFSAYESRSALNASLANTLDYVCNLFGHIFAAGDVVEEKQRLCSAADDVVNAHCHAVNTNGIVLVKQESELELGAYAVGAADKHGLCYAFEVKLKQAAETAYIRADPARHGLCYMLFHQLNGLVARRDVNAGGRVAVRSGILYHRIIPFRSSNRCKALLRQALSLRLFP